MRVRVGVVVAASLTGTAQPPYPPHCVISEFDGALAAVAGALSRSAEGLPIEQRLDIHPGLGIGPIRHGMLPAEVLAAFPEPQVYEPWMGGNLNDALLFRGLRLHFSECDSRGPLPDSSLNWVVIHQRPDAFLFGRPVGEWTKESVLEELRFAWV